MQGPDVGAWLENGLSAEDPGAETKEGGVDGGELGGKDGGGGRAREERWRRSGGNRQREKAESCMRIF